jgi:hypothetical protein
MKRSSKDNDFCDFNVKTRACSLCAERGHQRNSCPKISNWNGEVITSDRRSWFGNSLTSSNIYEIKMWFGPMNLQIANELPRGMKGIVVHDIYKYCNV